MTLEGLQGESLGKWDFCRGESVYTSFEERENMKQQSTSWKAEVWGVKDEEKRDRRAGQGWTEKWEVMALNKRKSSWTCRWKDPLVTMVRARLAGSTEASWRPLGLSV